MKSILSVFILLALYQLAYGYERVKLKDVQVLTLHRDRYTVGRKPIPQLTCSGLCKNQPDVVQCQNVGFDGIDYQWKCNANLDKNVKFRKLSVNCEGYDYPNDPYIIGGSCGLEYELAHQDHHGKSYVSPQSSVNDSSSVPFWVFIGFVAFFLMLMFCKGSDESSRTTEGYNYRGSATAPPPYSSGPAPGFKTEFTEPGFQQTAGGASSGTGFWSGLGLGALGGYMFGSRNSGSPYTSPPTYTDYNYYRPSRSSPSNTFYQDDCYTDRSSSQDTYQAEGYGSTKRR